MPEISPDRVAAIATAARVPLAAASAERVARAVTPTVTRFAAEPKDHPFETEPSSYVVVQRGEIGR
jgi:hypothetical protein